MTAADILVEELQARNVPFVASLTGHGLDPFHLACQRAGLRVMDVRNEQAASYAAEVAGRLSRSVGVCAVSGAVAHANAMSGVVNAWFDGSPMLLLTGITPLRDLGWGNFQDFNPVPVAAPVCKFARLLDVPERVAQVVHEAFAAATSGRPGPVHLALPLDVASSEVDPARLVRSPVRCGDVRSGGAAAPEAVQEMARLLDAARRPLLVAGSGVYYARGEAALEHLARQQRIPVVVPIWDRGSVLQPYEEFVGVIGAATGGPSLLSEADLILLAGAEFDYRVGQVSPPRISDQAAVIRIHADPARLRQGIECRLSVQGSPATVLEQLAAACRVAACPPAAEWLGECRRRLEAHRQRCLDAADRLPPGISGRDLVLAVRKVLTDETVLLVDGGNIGQWFHQLLTDRYPGHWVTCGVSGVVGWGLAGALSAKALYPDRPVLLLSGDGSFTFTLGELECASRQKLHFTAVVADDQRWGISASGHVRSYGRPLYSALGPTRLDLVAQGLGCRGVRVERKEQLLPALSEALLADAVTVIQVALVHGGPV